MEHEGDGGNGVAMTQSCRESDNASKIAVKPMGTTPGLTHTAVTLAKCKGAGDGATTH